MSVGPKSLVTPWSHQQGRVYGYVSLGSNGIVAFFFLNIFKLLSFKRMRRTFFLENQAAPKKLSLPPSLHSNLYLAKIVAQYLGDASITHQLRELSAKVRI